MNQNEIRFDPLRQIWTLFATARATAPVFAPRARPSGPSPFSAGHESLAPHTLYQTVAEPASPEGWQVRVVPNRVPVVRVEGSTQTSADGIYDRTDGVGAHEVVIETPGPEEFEELPLSAASAVVQAWQARMLELGRDLRMRSFFIVKDAGAPSGGTVPHAVSQFIALALTPPALKQKLSAARDFFERHKRSIFEDIVAGELRAATRIVYENSGMLAFCPYASRVPFEVMILPKRQHADFQTASREETAQLADALQSVLRRLNAALTFPAYNMALTTAPARTPRRDHWNTIEQDFRWHVELLPRLFPATGIDLATGCSVNPVFPETAAACLREAVSG